jgi:hypothetical protein
MLTFVTMPDPSTFLTAVTNWSSPVFDGLLPIAEVIVGVMVGVGIISLIVILFGKTFGQH